jgi:hypothetical protein
MLLYWLFANTRDGVRGWVIAVSNIIWSARVTSSL